jgi:hypothetical protein
MLLYVFITCKYGVISFIILLKESTFDITFLLHP